MSVISVKHADSYDSELLYNVVCEHFSALGVDSELKPGMKVLLKPNLLLGREPSKAVTTHPALITAVARRLIELGISDITLADSPGGLYTRAALGSVYSACQLNGLGYGIRLNDNFEWTSTPTPDGFVSRSFNIINPILEADYIINLPKLKTHGMTTISAGIKNLFGAVPGLQKPELHYKFPDESDFANMLVELSLVVKPNITIVDAVDGMEGNGPSGGTVRHTGLTFASRDVYSQDWLLAEFIGLQPEKIDMLRIAEQRGLISPSEIVTTGDALPEIEPFTLPESKALDFTTYVPKFLRRPAHFVVGKLLKAKPKVNAKLCIGCGKCAESCPPQIIEIRDKKAKMNLKNCISCFCCQEMCPVNAINAKRTINF